MGKADQIKEQAQSKSQHRAEREIKRRRATSGRPYIYIVRFIRICAIKQKQDSPHELSCLR